MYADNLSCGAESATEAIEIYKQAKDIMLKGSFNLRKWQSNDETVITEIRKLENEAISARVNHDDNGSKLQDSKVAEDDESFSQFVTGDPFNKGASTVLGVHWDSKSDNLFFDLCNLVSYAKSLPSTKRSVLKLAAKIFDPLGCLTAFTVNLKVLFQKPCMAKVPWDEPLEGPYKQTYDVLVSEMESLHGIYISRYLWQKGKSVKSLQLHGFSDASVTAYSAVLYLRIEYKDGKIETRFLASKSKVCPIKSQTIPRLELLGAVLLSKLVNCVRNSLKREWKKNDIDTYYWVDSLAALCWIRNCKPWAQYVRHRVSEILQISNREQWFHCPGFQNPADLPSRGKYRNLKCNSLWWEGPHFLRSSCLDWPNCPPEVDLETESAMKERLKTVPLITHAMHASDNQSICQVAQILAFQRFSSKGKLVRTMAWALRYISNLKASLKSQTLNIEDQVSVDEINNAEKILIKSIQGEYFKVEIGYLEACKAKKTGLKVPLYVQQFNLFIDHEGILRCRTRVNKSSLQQSSKTPVLMPSKHHYSELLIHEAHNEVFHNGITDTLNLLRQKYWVLRGREKVKRLIRRCTLCKKLEGLAFKTTFCPDLPDFRVDESPPFSHIGVDFAGPLLVKTGQDCQENVKVYVCLFTCAYTRAIHLETVQSLGVVDFIGAFRRFCARRGLPNTIVSDNAKTFKAASKEIRKLLRSPRLKEYFISKGVSWRSIVELAPFQGGFWERLVRSTKRCLIKIIGKAYVSYEELRTVIVEIESVINNRPITYVYDDTQGISYPLTPSQLINGRNLDRLPNDGHFEIVNTYESLSKRAMYHRRLLSHFSKRWKNEYLLNLMESYRPKSPQNEPIIDVDDVCILKNEQEKRSFWKLCRIAELLVGIDGAVRSARVEVCAKDGGKKTLNRSLKFLIPLEVRDRQESKQPMPPQSPITQSPHAQTASPRVSVPQSARPKRNAAVIGELLRKDLSLK